MYSANFDLRVSQRRVSCNVQTKYFHLSRQLIHNLPYEMNYISYKIGCTFCIQMYTRVVNSTQPGTHVLYDP